MFTQVLPRASVLTYSLSAVPAWMWDRCKLFLFCREICCKIDLLPVLFVRWLYQKSFHDGPTAGRLDFQTSLFTVWQSRSANIS